MFPGQAFQYPKATSVTHRLSECRILSETKDLASKITFVIRRGKKRRVTSRDAMLAQVKCNHRLRLRHILHEFYDCGGLVVWRGRIRHYADIGCRQILGHLFVFDPARERKMVGNAKRL